MPADSGARGIISHEQFSELFCIPHGELTDARPQRQKEIRDLRAVPNAPRPVLVAAAEMSGTPLRKGAVHLNLCERKLLDRTLQRMFFLGGDKFRLVHKPFRQIARE